MGRPFLRSRPATLRASSITASTKPPGRLQSATTGTKALWNFVQTEAIVALEPEHPSAEEAQLCPRPYGSRAPPRPPHCGPHNRPPPLTGDNTCAPSPSEDARLLGICGTSASATLRPAFRRARASVRLSHASCRQRVSMQSRWPGGWRGQGVSFVCTTVVQQLLGRRRGRTRWGPGGSAAHSAGQGGGRPLVTVTVMRFRHRSCWSV